MKLVERENKMRHIVKLEDLKGIIIKCEIVSHADRDCSKQLVVVTNVDTKNITFLVTTDHAQPIESVNNFSDAVDLYNSI